MIDEQLVIPQNLCLGNSFATPLRSVNFDFCDEAAIARLESDCLVIALRLLGEDDSTFGPECAEVMDRWRVRVMIHEYLSTRPSNHNYNIHRKELSSLFTFAIKQLKLLNHSPVWDLEKIPERPERKTIPTLQEILQLQAVATAGERALVLVVFYTAARIDEILRLVWKDVNFEQKSVTL